jgi:hypothetical protein
MNTAQKILLLHVAQRIHRTAHVGLCIAALVLVQAGCSWLSIYGDDQRLRSFTTIFPSAAWALVFSGGYKSMLLLPITRPKYEISRWLFTFVWPSLSVLTVSSIVYFTGERVAEQPFARMWLLDMVYNIGLLGLFTLLSNNDVSDRSGSSRFVIFKSGLSAGATILLICAILGMPTSGYWLGVVCVIAVVGVSIGILFPFPANLSRLRAFWSPLDKWNFDVQSAVRLPLPSGPRSFLIGRIVLAAVTAGAIVAAEYTLLSTKVFPRREELGSSSMAGLCVVWLASLRSIAALRVFRALPISLTNLAVAGIISAWLPTIFFYFWICILPGEWGGDHSTILTQFALLAAAQALLLPFLANRLNEQTGWRFADSLVAILAHVIVFMISRNIADDLEPAITLIILAGAGTFGFRRIRNVLASIDLSHKR